MSFISEIFGYVLNFFYGLINNYGIAIIIFSVLLRLLLIPITIKQQKNMKKSAKMQEKLKEIQFKYKNDPEKLNRETMELYKREKVSPFGGCLTGILQIIIILSVFWVVSQPLTYVNKVYNNEETKQVIEEYKKELEKEGQNRNYPEIQIISKVEDDYNKIVKKLNGEEIEEEKEEINAEEQNTENTIVEAVENAENVQNEEQKEVSEEVKTKKISEMTEEELKARKDILEKLRINMDFLGLDLSKVPTQNLSDYKVYIIPLLYVATSFISIKITTNSQKKAKDRKENYEDKSLEKIEENVQDNMQDSMNQMSNTMLYMMPIMSISIAAIAPLGLALYWLVSNILIILERLVINKFVGNKEDEDNE